jgi:acyl-CoA thioesterase
MTKEYYDKIKKIFSEHDLFAKHNGIEIVEVGQGTARCAMKVERYHLNGVGTVHGGAIFTLADFAFALASNSHGTIAVAINVNISFIKAGRGGTLYAEAHEVNKGSKLGLYHITITDDEGKLLATFEGMAFRKDDPLPTL